MTGVLIYDEVQLSTGCFSAWKGLGMCRSLTSVCGCLWVAWTMWTSIVSEIHKLDLPRYVSLDVIGLAYISLYLLVVLMCLNLPRSLTARKNAKELELIQLNKKIVLWRWHFGTDGTEMDEDDPGP